MDGLIQVIGAFFAILAFSVVIGAPRKYLVYCGLTGAIGWFVYLATLPGQGTVMANFWGAVVPDCSHFCPDLQSAGDGIPDPRYSDSGTRFLPLPRCIQFHCRRSEAGRKQSHRHHSDRGNDRFGGFYYRFPVFHLPKTPGKAIKAHSTGRKKKITDNSGKIEKKDCIFFQIIL